MTKESLERLRAVLLKGMQLSGQGTYERKAPAPKSVQHLVDARDGLLRFVAADAANSEAWRLLSQAHESLLNYDAAVRALEKAMALSGRRDRKDLKRLATLTEHQQKSNRLSKDQLDDLAAFLRERLGDSAGEPTFRITEEWLRANGISDPRPTIAAFKARGTSNDAEVLDELDRAAAE